MQPPKHMSPAFLQKPLHQLTHEEWESVCDGCGLCCLIRLEDEDTGELALTNAACRELCLNSLQCRHYSTRKQRVPDCQSITSENVHTLHWLPDSCAYRILARGDTLPQWHHLICGDKEAVHRAGISMRGNLLSEDDVEWDI